jgi:hypothetical protein
MRVAIGALAHAPQPDFGDHEAQQAAGHAYRRRFHSELDKDVAPPRTQRTPHAYLAAATQEL